MEYHPAPNCAKVEFVQAIGAQEVINTLNFLGESEPTITDLETLASEMKDFWVDNIMPALTTAIQLVNVRVTDLSSQYGHVVEFADGLPANGTVSAAPVPTIVAGLVTFTTPYRGRSNRGRIYYTGFSKTSLVQNQIQSDVITAIEDAFDALLATQGEGFWDWVILSRVRNGVVLEIVEAVTVTGFRVRDIIGTQRRRNIGVGS